MTRLHRDGTRSVHVSIELFERLSAHVRRTGARMADVIDAATADIPAVSSAPDASTRRGRPPATSRVSDDELIKRFATLGQMCTDHVHDVLEATGGDLSQAARVLDVDRNTVRRWRDGKDRRR